MHSGHRIIAKTMIGQKELKKVKATHTAFRSGFVTRPKAPTIVTQSVLLRRCFITTFCFCLLIPLLISVTPLRVVETPLRLVIIGDSTVCEYSSEHACCGWGQYVPVNRTSDHCKAAEFPMKACWKEDAGLFRRSCEVQTGSDGLGRHSGPIHLLPLF